MFRPTVAVTSKMMPMMNHDLPVLLEVVGREVRPDEAPS
jgi:hypothetical protein